jgi:hypothetical protein
LFVIAFIFTVIILGVIFILVILIVLARSAMSVGVGVKVGMRVRLVVLKRREAMRIRWRCRGVQMFEQDIVSTANLLELDSGIRIVLILVWMSAKSKLCAKDEKVKKLMIIIDMPAYTMFSLLPGRHPVDC